MSAMGLSDSFDSSSDDIIPMQKRKRQRSYSKRRLVNLFVVERLIWICYNLAEIFVERPRLRQCYSSQIIPTASVHLLSLYF